MSATINRQDFTQPDNSKSKQNGTLSNVMLRKSNFSIGDKNHNPGDHYDSIYKKTMTGEFVQPPNRNENRSYKSSILVNSEGPLKYTTESNTK